jgi:hypothetical protein
MGLTENNPESLCKGKTSVYRSISFINNCRAVHVLCFAGLAALVMSGCKGRESASPVVPGDTAAQKSVARSESELGPVKLTVTVDPSPARLSDEPTLTVEVAYTTGIALHKPVFGSSLSDFTILDFREPMPKVQGDREVLRQVYTLEPTRSGKIVIDPIAITFKDNRADGDKKEHSLQSERLTVEIKAAVASAAPSLAQLRPPAEPLAINEPFSVWWWALGAVVLIAAMGGGLLAFRRRRAAATAGPPPTPRELAAMELQRLWASFQQTEDVKVFYVELTATVRRYIERTTGVHAPEQTTQEFLHEISRRRDFPAEESARLKSFLESADLVKFAAYQPRRDDIEESYRRAKVFVGLDAGSKLAHETPSEAPA